MSRLIKLAIDCSSTDISDISQMMNSIEGKRCFLVVSHDVIARLLQTHLPEFYNDIIVITELETRLLGQSNYVLIWHESVIMMALKDKLSTTTIFDQTLGE